MRLSKFHAGNPRSPPASSSFEIFGDRGDRDIIMGSARQDLSRMEIEIQTLDQGEAIISTIGIPFPVSTRIHSYEDYIACLNKAPKKNIRDGLETGF